MKTYPIPDPTTGITTAFEIENAYIGPSRVAKVLRAVNGVSDIHLRQHFKDNPDVRVRFQYMGRSCVVLEPFGDNSRYCIGLENSDEEPLDLREIEEVFQSYEPPLLRRWIGDILTLRPLSRFMQR